MPQHTPNLEVLSKAVKRWLKADFHCMRRHGARTTEEFLKWNERMGEAMDEMREALTGTRDPYDAMAALGYEVDKPYGDNERPITTHRDYKPMLVVETKERKSKRKPGQEPGLF